MKKLKKAGALALAVLMIAVAGAAGAETINGGKTSNAPSLGNGTNAEKGVAGTWTEKDKPISQEKKINILKEITAFNPDEDFIYGPALEYTYTVEPASGTELVSITDEKTDHVSGQETTTTALGGKTAALVVNNGTAGNNASAVGTLNWTNADILDASANGTANYKNISLDFTNVVFTQPGVYRYKISESLDATSNQNNAYIKSGVTDGTIGAVRYLDVYVMRSSTYTDGKAATQWDIYGYVCLGENGITSNVTPSTESKTRGFIDEDGTGNSTADLYHTYNLTIGKTLNNDATMNTHKFPFTAGWETGTATGTFQFAVETSGVNGAVQVSSTTDSTTTSINGTTISTSLQKVGNANAVNTANKDGAPFIATGGVVKYIGIPSASYAKVIEKNDVAGTVYATRVYEEEYTTTVPTSFTENNQKKFDTNTSFTTAALDSDSKIATMVTNNKAARNQGAVDATPTAGAAPADDKNVHIQFTNDLSVISPTGYVARFAPYALILIAGIALLIVAKRRKPSKDED